MEIVEYLTDEEREALMLVSECWNVMCKFVGDVSNDRDELCSAVHLIQRYIMSNAAARAYPGEYRPLGQPL